MECEICTQKLSRRVLYKEKYYDLIQLEKPQAPYLILEKIEEDANVMPTIVIIKPTQETKIKLGRGHSCEMRINDISVSRVHSIIQFQDGHFRIFDNDSKFGTLVHLSQPYQVRTEKAAVQVGRTVFTFIIKNIEETPSSQIIR